jgi:hydroxymethylbilane synthase
MTRTLRIGTRGSPLALVQATWVGARLAELGVPNRLTIIRTEGDDRPIDTAWGEGAFVGRIVSALLEGTVDVAVHSAKDVPTDEHPDLVIAAYPPREDPRDALVCRRRGDTLTTLRRHARVGTDSPRRAAFLHAVRPDLRLHPLHGNVDTRLVKLERGDSDALVLAVAGLSRLGHADRIDDILGSDIVPSAPGQGALALQVRADDAEAIAAVARLDDPATRTAVEAERTLLNATGGGCRSPIGAIGFVRDGHLELAAGAERSYAPAPGAPILPAPVVRVVGRSSVADHRALAERLAARIVDLRLRPRVLVARPAGRAGALLDALHVEGVAAVHVPAIEIVPAASDRIDPAFRTTEPGDWIVLTSPAAVDAAAAAIGRTEVDAGARRWAAVGGATRKAAIAAGLPEPFLPSTPDGTTLAAELPVGPGDRVLLPRADAAHERLPSGLRARGATVIEVVAYLTREAPDASRPLLAAALDDGPLDALVLTSGSTAGGLLALAADDAVRARLLATPVIAIGPPTAEAATTLGYSTVLTAPEPGAPALAAFIASALGVERDARPRPDPSTTAPAAGGSR